MFENWMEILQNGLFDKPLTSLTVSGERIGTMNGTGQITWHADEGIRVRGVTDGGQALTRSLLDSGGFSGSPGRLYSHGEYFTFSGRTQDGWDVCSDPQPHDGYHTHSNLPEVIWDTNVNGVTFRRPGDGGPARALHVLMGPSLPIWPRMTETQVQNDVFGHSAMKRDWLVTTCGIGRVAARQRSDGWFEVQVRPHDGQPMCNRFEVCHALARSFGFLLGRRCVVRGHEEVNEGQITRRIETQHQKTASNTLYTPLGTQLDFLQNAERLLGLAIDFFLTEVGGRVATFLHLCWDTLDNAHPTQLAISGICIEGLLRLAAETLGPTQPQVAESDLTAFRAWLATRPAGFTQQFLNRLGGMAGTFRNLSANEIFRDWVNRGVLGVTRDDSQAWSDTRNPSAHGRITVAADQDELQVRVDRHRRLQNLVNRIVLQLIGYTGQYIDYTRPGFLGAEFPAFVPAAEAVAPSVPPTEPPVGA